MKRCQGLSPENGSSQGQNLALTVSSVPNSLDSGTSPPAKAPRVCGSLLGKTAFVFHILEEVRFYLTESVDKVVLQKSSPPQIRQLILYYHLYNG